MVLMEVCVDSILSAVNASQAGADRVELCSALSEGGLTPSLGLFSAVQKAIANTKTKIFCMIRIRRGNFNYSDEEIEAMVEDIKYFSQNGADGIVFGCLNSENEIDVEKCQKLSAAWRADKPITFHRAFDETDSKDFRKNIDILDSLGIKRILSSGYESSAELGIDNLKNMIAYASVKSMIIMPGAGITKENVAKVVKETGCKEIHASARSADVKHSQSGKLSMGGGAEDLNPLMICDPVKVKELIEISRSSMH